MLTSSFEQLGLSCRADADLKLLGSRKLPREAFKDKVVWITGASQVCPVPALWTIPDTAQVDSSIVQAESTFDCCSSYRGDAWRAGVGGGAGNLLCQPWREAHPISAQQGAPGGAHTLSPCCPARCITLIINVR